MAQGYNQSVESPTLPVTSFDPFIKALRGALQRELPGTAAQQKLAPPQRQTVPVSSAPARQSAVLALLHPADDGIALYFTVRLASLRHHAGQVSFPGGGSEAGDRTLAETALRETEEELGFSTATVNVLGRMTSLFIAPSHNLVHPFVGWLSERPALRPDPTEVAKVLDVPLAVLLDPCTRSVYQWESGELVLDAPCFLIDHTAIWGATAMILNELLEIIQDLPYPTASLWRASCSPAREMHS